MPGHARAIHLAHISEFEHVARMWLPPHIVKFFGRLTEKPIDHTVLYYFSCSARRSSPGELRHLVGLGFLVNACHDHDQLDSIPRNGPV